MSEAERYNGSTLLTIQPILDSQFDWGAFYLCSHPSPANPGDLKKALAALAGSRALGDADLIICHAASWLDQPALDLLPASRCILDIPSAEAPDEEALRSLQAKGFRVLSDAFPAPGKPAFADAYTFPHDELKNSAVTLTRAKMLGATLLARGITRLSDATWCTESNLELIDCRFLPDEPPPHNERGASRITLMQLLTLVAQDADTHEIEEALKKEPKLSYNLLRLVNSVSMGASTKIASFGQAITLLGRRQLQRWLQLLLYTNPESSSRTNPLMRQAALRGRLMEHLCAGDSGGSSPSELQDRAFMTGVLSLIDVLLGLPMPDILASVSLADEVQEALLKREGVFGALLNVVTSLEQCSADKTAALLDEADLKPGTLLHAQIAALDWASNIGNGH